LAAELPDEQDTSNAKTSSIDNVFIRASLDPGACQIWIVASAPIASAMK